MTTEKVQENFRALGFPGPLDVTGLASIVQDVEGSRCGVYLLYLGQSTYYIGQSVEVTKRYREHVLAGRRPQAFAFLAARSEELDALERDKIREARSRRIALANVLLEPAACEPQRDLDAVVPRAEQLAWLAAAAGPAPGTISETVLTASHEDWNRLKAEPGGLEARAVARSFVRCAIPRPAETQMSFWSCHAMPRKSSSRTAIGLISITAGMCALMTLGTYTMNRRILWATMLLDEDLLDKGYKSREGLARAYPWIAFEAASCPGGCERLVRASTQHTQDLLLLLEDGWIRSAAASSALTAMRSRPPVYARLHCQLLANDLMGVRPGGRAGG